MTSEVWKELPGWEGLYEVSNNGRIRSLPRNTTSGRILKASDGGHPGGYLDVGLSGNGKRKTIRIHVAVMLAFVGPPPEGTEVRHLDGNPENNHIDNLKYGTRRENNMDKFVHGTDHYKFRTQCSRGHEYTKENTRVYKGGRYCRACQRFRKKESK